MPNRVCFLVDGFNVYHSIIEAIKAAPPPAASMKWLDFLGFCRSFLPSIGRDAVLEKVFYFSASADFLPDKAARHAILVAAIRHESNWPITRLIQPLAVTYGPGYCSRLNRIFF
jgi:hypothetical protein